MAIPEDSFNISNLMVTATPPPIALVDNGLKFKLQGVNYTLGSKAYLRIQVTGDYTNYQAGQTFSISWSNETLTFYFTDAPTNDGLSIKSAIFTETLKDIRDRMISVMKSNYILSKYFEINFTDASSNYYIDINARNTGSDYTLTFDNTSGDIVEITNLIGTNTNIPSDYRVYLALCLYDESMGDQIEPLGEDLLYIDDEMAAEDDLANYIKDQLITTFTFPFAGNNIIELTNAVKKYFIRYGEYKENTFRSLVNTFANPLIVLPGGLSEVDKELLRDLDSDYFSFGYNAKRFLTWAPISKNTIIGVTEKLYFFVQAANLKLMKKAVYADNTVISEVGTISAVVNSIIEIFAGAVELFTLSERDGLLSYQIWIEDANGDAVSEIRTFIIDQNEYPQVRTFIFKNSFGVFDTFTCTGTLKTTDKVTGDTYEVWDGNAFKNKAFNIQNNREYQLNTGWLQGKETRLWLTELLMSEEVYLITGSTLLPVVLNNSKKIPRTDDLDDLYSIDLSFNPAFSDNGHNSLMVGEGIQFVLDGSYKIFTDKNSLPYVY